MRISKLCLLVVFLLVFHSAKGDIIINSQDWRDAYLGLLYSRFRGEDAHYLINLGETDLLLKSLNKEEKHEVFESMRKPVIKNLDEFMKNYGFGVVSKTTFSDYKELQFSLYQNVKDKIKGFIVLHPDFGKDAISVFPLALAEKRWVFFYTEETESKITNILNSNPEKSVVFYGEFFSQPWKKIKNRYEIIYGSSSEMNKKVVERVWKAVDGWVAVSSGAYLEKGSLIQGKPILLAEDTPKNLAEFLKKLGVRFIEVIGPENVNFGYAIREASNKTIGVVAKIGRTFTGDPELRGKFYTLPVKPVSQERHELEIEEVVWDGKKVVIVLKNKGNVKETFQVRAARFVGNEEITFADPRKHVIYPGEILSLPYEGNFSSISKAEILVLYGENLEYRIRNKTTGSYFFSVTKKALPRAEKPELREIFYDDALERLWIKIAAPQEEWVRVEIYNFTFLNRSITLSTKTIRVKKGENLLPISIYLDKGDIDKLGNLTLRVFYGPEKGLLTDSFEFTQSKKIEMKRVENTWVFIALAVIVMAVLASYTLFRKGVISFENVRNFCIRKK